MINLKSVIDGFSVIIGPYWCNLAALITLLTTIRAPPDYDDEEENRQAKAIFATLVLGHLILGLFGYLSTWQFPRLNEYKSTVTYGAIILDAIICYQWVFPRPFN